MGFRLSFARFGALLLLMISSSCLVCDVSASPVATTVSAPQTDGARHKFRKWKSASNKHTIYARMIAFSKGRVKLFTEDGRTINVRLKDLSPFDREYVEETAAKSQSDNPFETAKTPKSQNSKTTTKTPATPESGPDRTSSSLMPSLEAQLAELDPQVDWQVPAEAVTAEFEHKPVVDITFDHGKQFSIGHGSHWNSEVSLNGRFAVMTQRSHFHEITSATLVDLDLGNFRKLAGSETPLGGNLIVSPSGKYVAGFNARRGSPEQLLRFWRIDDQNVAQIGSWKFSRFHHGPFRATLMRCDFLSDNHLLTSLESFVAVWDWQKNEAAFSFKTLPGSIASTSPNGRLIAARPQPDVVAIIDANDGRHLGNINLPGQSRRNPVFSTDSRYLAGTASGGSIWIHDLLKNERLEEIQVGKNVVSIHWAGPRHLLVNQSQLIDALRPGSESPSVDLGKSSLTGSPDGRIWTVSAQRWQSADPFRSGSVTRMPDVNRQPSVSQPLTPGTGINVDIDIPFDNFHVIDLQKRVARAFEERGFVVSRSADLHLSFTVESLDEYTATFEPEFGHTHMRMSGEFPTRMIPHGASRHKVPEMPEMPDLPGFPGDRQMRREIKKLFERPTEKVIIRPKMASITLTCNGELAWKKQTLFEPSAAGLERNPGETTQQAVDRLCWPDPEFFKSWTLPRYLTTAPPVAD